MFGGRDFESANFPVPGVRLTSRQFEVIKLAASGLTAKQIASYLGLSPRTVEDRFSELRKRTGAKTQGELIGWAVAAGIVRPGSAPPSRQHNDRGIAKRTFTEEHRKSRANNQVPTQELTSSATLLAPPAKVTKGTINGTQAAAMLPTVGPAVPTGTKIGYARSSQGTQHLERQINVLKAASCRRVFAEENPGQEAGQPELAACLELIQAGDTLVVPSLDTLSHSVQHLITTVVGLSYRQAGFRSLYENLDTTTPDGRLAFHVFTALALFIRDLIMVGARERPAAVRPQDRAGGRPAVITPQSVRAACEILPNPDTSITAIAKLLDVNPGTLYNRISHLPSIG